MRPFPLWPVECRYREVVIASRLFAAASVLVLGAALASCSSSSGQPSAEEQACSARSALQSSWGTFTNDVRDLNFGAAKDDLATVQTAFDALVSAQQDLSAEKRDQIQPDLDTLRSSLSALQESTSLSDINADLASARAAIDSALAETKRSADCS